MQELLPHGWLTREHHSTRVCVLRDEAITPSLFFTHDSRLTTFPILDALPCSLYSALHPPPTRHPSAGRRRPGLVASRCVSGVWWQWTFVSNMSKSRFGRLSDIGPRRTSHPASTRPRVASFIPPCAVRECAALSPSYAYCIGVQGFCSAGLARIVPCPSGRGRSLDR